MLDFRLNVFYTVAQKLNFTKAAAELFISQPAVTKHIRELEAHFNTKLFERSGNSKISLTPAGQLLLAYAEKVASAYRELESDLNLLSEHYKGVLRLGASTTAAQYIMPVILAQFRQKFKEVKISFLTGNTEQIEQALIDKKIDIGFTEGLSHHLEISYQHFLDDELVLVASTGNSFKKETIKPDDLKAIPLLLREQGSGTLEVIADSLKKHHIKLSDLKIEMQLESTESIKNYLFNSNCMAFLSVHAILKELRNSECRIIDVKGLSITRPFSIIQLHGQPLSLAKVFTKFALANNKF
ncbi:LysR substrate-binding domain-containing protein [Mucilaginibacter sp. KACC 22063]|uniref:LysR substrate-binding domain-containing protein n=1 Tax=Mucilaginibacter sp. KACC 22063 TaxID=3025666 RepID=UPI002366DACF|nr:LysR substrate-binding domain-containing protein [Mucilaginibacter sp. KACC 22063]WDF56176.1 LysR substrate-binding domain-containing protein [Mucilaginibacter sp. KACC 22063]